MTIAQLPRKSKARFMIKICPSRQRLSVPPRIGPALKAMPRQSTNLQKAEKKSDLFLIFGDSI